MHFTYAVVVCSRLSQVISELYIFNWMPTIRALFVNVNSVVILRSRKGSAQKQAWRTLACVIQALFRVIVFGMKTKKLMKNKKH